MVGAARGWVEERQQKSLGADLRDEEDRFSASFPSHVQPARLGQPDPLLPYGPRYRIG